MTSRHKEQNTQFCKVRLRMLGDDNHCKVTGSQTEDIASKEIQVQCTGGRDDTDFFQIVKMCRNKDTKALSDFASKQSVEEVDRKYLHHCPNRVGPLCELLLHEKSRKENQRNDITNSNVISTQNSVTFGSDKEGRYGIVALLQKRRVMHLSCFDSLVSSSSDEVPTHAKTT